MNIIKIIVAFALFLIIAGCKRTYSTNNLTEVIKQDTTEQNDYYPEKPFIIDFFGQELVGDDYESIIKKMEATGKVTDVELKENNRNGETYSYYVMNFCGVPCALNMGTVTYKGKEYAGKLNFMTSRQTVPTYMAFVKGISEYYGKPEEDEIPYDPNDTYRTYIWGLSEIKVRNVRSDDGGITVIWNKTKHEE